MRKVLILALAAAMLGAFAPAVQAVPTLSFIIPQHAGGIVAMDPDGQGVWGEQISIDEVVGTGTPLNSGVHLALTNGHLFFKTGNFNGFIAGSTYLYLPGKYIQIYGGVPGTTPPLDSEVTLLLNGAFIGVPEVDVRTGGGTVVGDFSATVNSILASFYGLTGKAFTDGSIDLDFATANPLNPPNSFWGNGVGSGVVVNEVGAVPLPGAALLLGSGLIGLAALPFRRK